MMDQERLEMKKIAVIGAGPAGMMAAIAASENGHQVELYDQNERLGKKLYITGKGRCNLTNNRHIEDYFSAIISNPRFLYSALYQFTNQDFMAYMENHHVPLKVERGERVFPSSDKSSDVIKGFERGLKEGKVAVFLNHRVSDLIIEDQILSGIQLANKEVREFDRVILASGGKSYPATGSDGYFLDLLKKYHQIIRPRPALVPIVTKEDWPLRLQGLALKNVSLSLYEKKKKITSDMGEMVFTHFGISGPLVLSLSSRMEKEPQAYSLRLDLKPALNEDQLEKRLQRDFEKYSNKNLSNGLKDLLPAKLIPVIVELSGIDGDQKINQVTKSQRGHLVKLLKGLSMSVETLRGFNEAIITAGGLSTKEVDPSTMASKIIKNLFFAGEILDVDALTGGYNIQLAVSTGFLAGKNV